MPGFRLASLGNERVKTLTSIRYLWVVMHDRKSYEQRPRVLLAEDHCGVAERLRSLLEGSCQVIGVVQNGQQLLEAAPRLKPTVIVLDISMPVLSGLDAARQLKQSFPDTKFVFLTMHNDPNLAAAALALGAVGYVLKHSASSELVMAISEVLQGRSYVTPKCRSENSNDREMRPPLFRGGLTPRQEEVLQLIAKGRPLKEIADILKVSEKAIEFHKSRIMETFNLKDNADLVSFALDRGVGH